MSRDSPLTVAKALTVPPLDRGVVRAGHRGLTREVVWVDIMHAPAESFIRAGDLVMTTGADVGQPGVREFLTFLVSSSAAGAVVSPPPEVPVDILLASLLPLADRYDFPVVLLPWEIAFAEVQRSLLPLVTPTPAVTDVQMAIGRRQSDDGDWDRLAAALTEALYATAREVGLTVRSSITDDLVMSHLSAAASASTVSELVATAQKHSGLGDDLVSWVLLPPADRHAVAIASVPSAAGNAVGPRQFAEVLRQHPQSMATILRTLRPLVEHDQTRRGQLVHTLEILLNEATNTSAAARALFLNRHSLL